MGQIRCYGYSDDTAIIMGTVNSDMYCYDSRGIGYGVNAVAKLRDGNGEGCNLIFVYSGNWAIAIEQIDEEQPIPPWVSTARVTQGTDNDSCRYSTVLTMDVPDDLKIIWEGQEDEEE